VPKLHRIASAQAVADPVVVAVALHPDFVRMKDSAEATAVTTVRVAESWLATEGKDMSE
jgi:hypothetical protein